MSVSSTMLPLGTPAPDFKLRDTVSGELMSLSDFDDTVALLVMFICNHCPYVQHIRHGLAELGRDYANADVAIVAISSNDPVAYPSDGPEAMATEAAEIGYTFPYLFDETQDTARAYTAACTPDFFLFGADRKLVYRGQFDSTRPGQLEKVTGADVREALEALIAGEAVSADQSPSVGCSIKWSD
jgi:peroxiredoxin